MFLDIFHRESREIDKISRKSKKKQKYKGVDIYNL